MKKPAQGGKRAGSGRKPGPPTKVLSITAPAVDVDAARKKHGRKLHSMGKAWIKKMGK